MALVRPAFVLVLLAATASAQPAPDGAGSASDGTGSAAPSAPLPPVPPSPPPPPAPAPLTRADVEAIVAAHAPAEPPAPVKAAWKDGFWIDYDRGFKLRVGLILQYDGRFFVDDSAETHTDQFAFRSTRLDLAGTVYDHYDFRFMPDFAGGKVVVQDAYFDVHYCDYFKLRFGKMKVPFGLERLQDEKSTTFTERGLPTQLAPNRDLGVQAFGELGGGTLTYQLGLFNGVADGGSGDGDVSSDKEGAARVFVRPFANGPDVVKDLGFGGAVTYGDKHGHLASPDVGSFRTPGQTTFFQYKVGTTTADTVLADGRHWRATGQAYWYTGPLGLLGEYVRSRQHIELAGRHDLADLEAWQLLVQWVITGEHASYKSVRPKGKYGAFDVAARVGELRVVDAGTLDNGFADPTKSARRAWSAGIGGDWFANRVVRFVLDVDRTWYTRGAKVGDRPAETSIIGRAQLAF
jgi:phosphate-selective porin OprO/OprP